MQFLKILFWCLLAFVAAIFTVGNWNTIDIRLWSGLVAQINLPLLLLLTFLAGMLPTMLYYRAARWRLRNRLATTERALGDLRTATTPPPALPPIAEPGPMVDTVAAPALAPAAKPRTKAANPAPLFPDAS
ncbi:MAG: hypothetical protein ABIS14_01050 [Sphingomonas sp.]